MIFAHTAHAARVRGGEGGTMPAEHRRLFHRMLPAWVIIVFTSTEILAVAGPADAIDAARPRPVNGVTAHLSGPPPQLLPASLGARKFPVPFIPYAPRVYACAQTLTPPIIDGVMDEPAWQKAPRTEEFGDIEGSIRPTPRFHTRARMLWDDTFFYVGAEMEEPDLWATYDRRDMVIYHENDFEVFIDPDGDTHEYYELEMNALNTAWDLLLIRPYRDGGPAVNAWDIAGLTTAVHLDGTLNDPRDRDRGWTVEIAFPWTVLAECAHRAAPPADGDQWRVNFSRVEWRIDPREGGYEKRKDPASGKALPEDNWTWSPQGLVAMHYPEMWGVVQFCAAPAGTPGAAGTPSPAGTSGAAGTPSSTVRPDPDAHASWTLRLAYYAEKELFERERRYSADRLELPGFPPGPVELRVTRSGFEATLPSTDGRGTLHIRDDGRSGRTEP
jgi:hypothetical protein